MSKSDEYMVDVMKPPIGSPSTIWRDYGFYAIETEESIDRRNAHKIYTEKYMAAFAAKLKEMVNVRKK